MDLELESLDLPIPLPFHYVSGQHILNPGLLKSHMRRTLLDPIPQSDFNSWISMQGTMGDSDTRLLVPSDPHHLTSVGYHFGPGGEDRKMFYYRRHDDCATTDRRLRMTLVTTKDEVIVIVPMHKHRRLTRSDVEMRIAQWMHRQRELPLDDLARHDVQSEMINIPIRGVMRQVGVWLWRGLELMDADTNTWKIHL